ncbi:MAG TPA: heme-binding protein [Allosphingosinicella sp.]|nr:heme-binding protein [Allosphingosinicella sp.]
MAGTHDVRLHGAEIDFGNLAGLVGTWTGANGFNMIAVPDQQGEFTLLVDSYTETLVVNKVPATTPNRGYKVIENIPTLQYSTTISETPLGSLMHVECGFWELSDPTLNGGFDIFRIASVPHGNAVEVMGTSSVIQGPPTIDPTLNGAPTGDLPPVFGYKDPYGKPDKYPNFTPQAPNQTLIDYLANQQAEGLTVTQTVILQVSTQNMGGMSNIASLQPSSTQINVIPTEFDATFWLETLQDGKGNTFQQLQYSQRILLDFPAKQDGPGQTIVWPHINVNTLTLVS